MKLATKLFIGIFLSTAAMICGLVFIAHVWISQYHLASRLRHAGTIARLVVHKSEPHILHNDLVELYRFFRSTVTINPIFKYIFVQQKNRILVNTMPSGVPKGLLQLPPLQAPHQVDTTPIEDNQSHLIYHLRIATITPAQTVFHFGVSKAKIEEELDGLRHLVLGAGALLLATVPLVMALVLARMVSRPIAKLRDGVERIGRGELDARIDVTGKNEIEKLAGDINTMAERLEKLRDGLKNEIAERQRMEKTLVQTQKMEAIGTLAGGIAHDFNNILGSIIGYTELSVDEIPPDTPVRDYLQQVLKAAMRAKELVRQILTFSRKSREERRPIQLSTIVIEEVKLLRATLPTTIEIRKTIDDRDDMVYADATQMHQVVMNLCTNAAHAMQAHGGVLEIKLSQIVVTRNQLARYHGLLPGPFLALSITDNGIGMDASLIQRIFEPFFTTKPKGKGTGMGLAVVHGIVKDHGGDIVVESNPGEGTTFTILLPKSVTRQAAESTPAPELLRGSEHLLLVDDEPSLLDMGQKILSSLGYTVTTANSSLDALESVRHAPSAFDAIISDHTMPHMTGLEMAKAMLKLNQSARIVLCTGHSDSLTPEKVAAAGIRALLYKPIQKSEFARTIRYVLDA